MCKILEKKNQLPVSDQSDAIVFTLQQVLEAIELYLDQVRDPVSYPQLSIIGYTLPPPPTFPNSNVTLYPDDLLIEEDNLTEEEPFIVLSKPGPIEDI